MSLRKKVFWGVAPLAGAWIETVIGNNDSFFDNVAPLAGAWIETLGLTHFFRHG